MDNDNSRNNEGISYYSFIIVFPILPYIIEYYYVVQFMYYINPNKRVLLYYPIPCISIQIIIKFCAFVTSILRKKKKSPIFLLIPLKLRLQRIICKLLLTFIPYLSSFIFILLRFGVDLCHLASVRLHQTVFEVFPKIMQKVSLGIFFCSLSCC